jgi:hypothetical protein
MVALVSVVMMFKQGCGLEFQTTEVPLSFDMQGQPECNLDCLFPSGYAMGMYLGNQTKISSTVIV